MDFVYKNNWWAIWQKIYSIASWCFFKHIVYSRYIISSLAESSSIFTWHLHSLSLLLSAFEIIFPNCLLQKMNFGLLHESQIRCILYIFAMFNQQLIIILLLLIYTYALYILKLSLYLTYLTAANKLHACAVHVICMASTLTVILIPTTIIAVV